ncbi:hypothetical protein P7K49_025044 [Saguinus oedipus]|uniref:Uncharacterized protein n=1 Tax=Saguinus oedipus TaxID=9490 RepID=A0ABQ9UGU9_SAGOE|nr:hypothetical protein P7K49_025044 [Saguinus oedipus]
MGKAHNGCCLRYHRRPQSQKPGDESLVGQMVAESSTLSLLAFMTLSPRDVTEPKEKEAQKAQEAITYYPEINVDTKLVRVWKKVNQWGMKLTPESKIGGRGFTLPQFGP